MDRLPAEPDHHPRRSRSNLLLQQPDTDTDRQQQAEAEAEAEEEDDDDIDDIDDIDAADESQSLLPHPAGPSSSSSSSCPPPAASGWTTPLLAPSSAPSRAAADGTMQGTRLGKIRAYWLGCVVCIGGFLFGYDSGIVGGVLTLASFERDYGYSAGEATRVDSLAVGLQQLGAFVACFLAWPLTDRLGRRRALMVSSLVFCAGALIQTINTHSLAAFYVGRVTAGLGLGTATVVVPMFSSEMSPAALRGRIGSFFQWFYTFGIFVSYWVDYGVALGSGGSSRQWQIPIGLQLVPGALLGLGMLTLRESTRWLAGKGRHDEALESLRWIRADPGSQAVLDEMAHIRAGVEAEARAREGFHPRELLLPDNLRRVTAAFAIFLAQQATGATAFAYFGPQYFKLLVGAGNRDLLLTAIFGAVKVLACGLFVLFVSERVGRRKVLIAGAAFMAACQITTAAVDKAMPPPAEGSITSAGIAMVALIYLFVIAYNFSWGPMPWPYVSEIFPARIREPGVAIGVGSQWLFNFVFSLTTPYMIKNMGWGTFLLWGVFDAVIAVLAFFFLKETKGLSLETIAHQQFTKGGGASGDHDKHSIKHVDTVEDGPAP